MNTLHTKREISLAGNWTAQIRDPRDLPEGLAPLLEQGVTARVPGNIHNALAELIPDPYLGDNEQRTAWIGRQGWSFSRPLPALPKADRYELVAHGLDTVASVSIDGVPVGQTRNMHRTYRFDVTELVDAGAQEIEVLFASPYDYTDEVAQVTGAMPGPYDEPYALIRKMAANYGWDWGPTVVTSGIWRDLTIEAWKRARLRDVRMSATVASDGTGLLRVEGTVSRAEPTALTLDLTCAGVAIRATIASEEDSFSLLLKVPAIQTWWPHTMGAQPLYEARLELSSQGREWDRCYQTVGFRNVELLWDPEADGAAFGFIVNGQETFARGWNWIPNDPLVDRVTPEDYRRRLNDVKDSGADWVRVWGGGIYESDAFYEACDQLGLLVWQDFAMACSAYPETPEFLEEVRHEAEDNVTRLMHHPSLALWNGNNENYMGIESWGWEEELAGRPWGERYYQEIFPQVVTALDPSRPYWPGSPYSGGLAEVEHNDPDYGCFHSWEVWNRQDYLTYLETEPRFVSEFGWQAPPAHSTLAGALAPGDLRLDSPALLGHQKAEGGMEKLVRGFRAHIGEATDLDSWLYLSQVIQARAIQTGLGHWRSLWPRCRGTFVWQINDCWPSISWAGVDVAGRRKPMWYAARRSYGDRLSFLNVSGKPGPVVHLVNQGQQPWEAEVKQTLFSTAHGVTNTVSSTVVVAPSSVIQVPLTLAAEVSDARTQLVVVDVAGQRDVWLAGEDRDFAYPLSQYEARLERDGEDYLLTVTAASLLRDLLLQVDRISPELWAEAELVTLLPGESHTWKIGAADFDGSLEDTQWQAPLLTGIGDLIGHATS